MRWRLWDKWHGVRTTDIVEVASLGRVGPNKDYAVRYEPSGSVIPTLKELQLDYRRYAFVDFGSGKGRVLLQASQFPFLSIAGVEFSSELHKTAERNIRSYRRANVRCRAVRSVCQDATQFRLPSVPLVLYFFNPFYGPVLDQVVANIKRSVELHRREVVLLRAGKWMARESFECLDGLKTIWDRPYSSAYIMNRGYQAYYCESCKERAA
jgi:hypothetical protein